MQVHLVVPGLLWPHDSRDEATRGLALPALSLLCGRGRLRWHRGGGLESWLAARFGMNGATAPYAALRLAGEDEGSAPDRDGTWVAADPVTLRFARNVLVLADESELQVTADEARALVAALNAHFAELGTFVAPHPARWYLRLHTPCTFLAHPPSQVIGRRIDAFLPTGPDGRRWHGHFNEAQMLLHSHPVNREREAAGRHAINSLWFWGAGELARTRAGDDAVIADDPLARGLAAASGITCQAFADRFSLQNCGAAARTLIVASAGARPAHYLDIPAWRSALERLERQWIAPALQALRAGRVSRLSVTGLGDEAACELSLARRDLWKLWTRPLPLARLMPPPSSRGKSPPDET
ncbi:MAG: hypothetical protein HY778_12650 [Betaproteobacteria bacterium]|nr:hypothetical protein [Betaproteobacteria bacterium]